MANKSKELGQQAGIIDYINKLSSNAAAAAAATDASAAAHSSSGTKIFNGASASPVPAAAAIVSAQAIAVQGGEKATRVVPDSDEHQHEHL